MERLKRHEIVSEIDRTESALLSYGRRSIAFRPPFGTYNDLIVEIAHKRQLPMVLWDVVSGDPSPLMTAEGMIKSVVRNTRSGSILIFHINGRATQTATALPFIFQQLRDRGFQFVHLSTLLAHRQNTFAVHPHADLSRHAKRTRVK
jgi:peptidoglycan/xylan/chitin deacetylase (PgdA/CDA1 family)